MMIDWNEYHNQVKEGTAKIGRISPDIFRGYRMIGDAAKKSDLLGPKVRELIALAVAVTVQCDGLLCIPKQP